MRFDIITIFPEMFSSVFSGGIINKAIEKGKVEIYIHDLRNYALDKHRQVDDRPYGGQEGMVLKPEPVFLAVNDIRKSSPSRAYLLSPQGRKLDSRWAEETAGFSQVILICGRYEGVDERVVEFLVDDEISIGDYVISGGEPAAVVLVDAISRFVPGVVGRSESVRHDSFVESRLDFPHYTRPRDFRGMKVPGALFSGDHKKIERWRKTKALEKTLIRRPDLLARKLTQEEEDILRDIRTARKERIEQ